MARGQDMPVRMDLVGAGEVSRAGQEHRVIPVGSSFRGEQIVPAVAPVKVRTLGQAE
jgi:hypothetical protein